MSIVVPFYNAEATVRMTLESLRRQTLSGIEILAVDDGSTDGGPAIVQAATEADRRIRMFRQENRGLAGARNTGIRMARAPLIGFCDADDLWAPGKAAAHAFFLAARPDVGLSFSGSVIIDDDSIPLGFVQRPALHNVDLNALLCGNPIGNGSTAVISRACLDDMAFPGSVLAGRRTCWFDESYRQSEDIELWCRIQASRWRIAGIRAPLTGYRVRARAESLSSDAQAQIATWKRIFESLPGDFRDLAGPALALQWRCQARKAIFAGNGLAATEAMIQAMRASLRPLATDFGKTAGTVAAAAALTLGGRLIHQMLLRRLRGRSIPPDADWVYDYVMPSAETEIPIAA
jgi:glycosyltransferase involved in cell wall biosynthesis